MHLDARNLLFKWLEEAMLFRTIFALGQNKRRFNLFALVAKSIPIQ